MNLLRLLGISTPAIAMCMAAAACGNARAADESTSTPANPATAMSTDTLPTDTSSATVKVETTEGAFTVLLYGDTPRHRDNFLKLVREGYYDGTLFHRVIRDFMIQAGDPDSRTAAPGQRLGAGGPGYTIEAEIMYPRHFHKRYTLAAARQGDQVNPEKRSSGSQFYITTGRRMLPAQLDAMAGQMRGRQLQETFNGLVRSHMSEIQQLQAKGDTAALNALQQQLIARTEAAVPADAGAMPAEVKEAYAATGGAPHLDGAYTVFGEVIAGQDVIDRIEKAETDRSDRPASDIRIIKMQVVE